MGNAFHDSCLLATMGVDVDAVVVHLFAPDAGA
jgi:hypothetical protein